MFLWEIFGIKRYPLSFLTSHPPSVKGECKGLRQPETVQKAVTNRLVRRMKGAFCVKFSIGLFSNTPLPLGGLHEGAFLPLRWVKACGNLTSLGPGKRKIYCLTIESTLLLPIYILLSLVCLYNSPHEIYSFINGVISRGNIAPPMTISHQTWGMMDLALS